MKDLIKIMEISLKMMKKMKIDVTFCLEVNKQRLKAKILVSLASLFQS